MAFPRDLWLFIFLVLYHFFIFCFLFESREPIMKLQLIIHLILFPFLLALISSQTLIFIHFMPIFTFFLFGETRNLTTFTRLMDYNNGFSLSSFFLSLLSFLWIGAQFPQEKFLSYGRILTLDYYFLLMCILFSKPFLYFSFTS